MKQYDNRNVLSLRSIVADFEYSIVFLVSLVTTVHPAVLPQPNICGDG